MHTPTDTPSPATQSVQKQLPSNYNPNAKGVMGEFWKRQKARVDRDLKIEELDDAIGQLNRSINASSYQLLVLIREFDERAGWLKWSFTDGVNWLKWRCDLGTGTAREKLRIAHSLKELPLISDAFANGNLSYSKVRVMTRVATVENEADLIELARRMTVRHLTEHCKQRSNAQKASTALAQAAQNSRAFRVWHDSAKGTMHFSLELPIEEGELLEQAVDKAAVRLSTEIGLADSAAGEEASWSMLQADAIVDVMRGFLSAGPVDTAKADSNTPSDNLEREAENKAGNKAGNKPASSSSADHHLVMIHVDESALLQSSEQSINSTSINSTSTKSTNPDNATSQYPIETVRRLCCDGSIATIIENSKGEPLHVGRRMRTVTTAIRRALWARDGGCVFPGCNHKRFVDAHHIKHWADGGETSVENMVLLCSNHHKQVHEGGFQIRRDQSGELFFRRPDGKALPHCGYYRDDWIDFDCIEIDSTNIDSTEMREKKYSINNYSNNYTPADKTSTAKNSPTVEEAAAQYLYH